MTSAQSVVQTVIDNGVGALLRLPIIPRAPRRRRGEDVKGLGEYVGAYIADIVVEETIILELKSVKALTEVMEAQIVNYLKLSGLPVGYLINFYKPRAEWRRFVNQRE